MNTDMVTMPLPWPNGWVLYWPIAAEIIGALALPVAGLLALILVLPMVLRAGGSIEAFGAKVSVAQKQVEKETRKLSADVDKNMREEAAENEDPSMASADIAAERPIPANSMDAINAGWNLIDEATRQALKAVKAPAYVAGYMAQNPIWTFNYLALERLIGLPLRDTIKSLIELRMSALEAKQGGSSILTEDSAREFNIAAQKAAKAITNAINYRLRKMQEAAPA